MASLGCCRGTRNKLVSPHKLRRYRQLQKAETMLNRQFDVTNLLKGTQMNQLLVSALLTHEQRLLLMYQRKQIVED